MTAPLVVNYVEKDSKQTRNLISSFSPRFRIQSEVASGNFCCVYKAKDVGKNIFVAVKVFNKGVSKKRSEREVQYHQHLNLKNLDEPKNVMMFYQTYIWKQRMCIISEFFEWDLHEYWSKKKQIGIPEMDIVSIIQSILKGLEFLHGLAIIHTNITMFSIGVNIGSPLQCKILDLGQCVGGIEPVEDDQRSLVLREYKAPELLLVAPFDEKIDIWSVACIAGTLIKGFELFKGTTDAKQMSLYVEHLGLPPIDLLKRSSKVSSFFRVRDEEIFARACPPNKPTIPSSKTLQDTLRVPHDHDMIDFFEKSLCMNPTTRFSAEKLLAHPWMKRFSKDSNVPVVNASCSTTLSETSSKEADVQVVEASSSSTMSESSSKEANVSVEALRDYDMIDFFEKSLCMNPTTRFSAEQLLVDAWLKRFSKDSNVPVVEASCSTTMSESSNKEAKVPIVEASCSTTRSETTTPSPK